MIGTVELRADIRWSSGDLIAGKYEVLKKLGSGGMGLVYAGRHLQTGEHVALKVMRAEAEDPNLAQRLLREARAAASVRHPNVVEIREVLQLEAGTPVIVMELLSGESLRDLLRSEGRLSLEQTARYLLPVASAVGAAHARGIIHRDLKPDNIFLSRDASSACVVKVLDFGIAKLTRIDGETTQTLGLTATGAVLGTPNYMSPEQIFGERDVDQRADIWALGVILYECLSGVLPTEGSNVGQVLKLIVAGGIPPFKTVVPNAPSDITRLISRMLARDRNKRPYNLSEVVEVLRGYTDARAPTFSTPPTTLFARVRWPRLKGRGRGKVVLRSRHIGAGDAALGRDRQADDTRRQLASAISIPLTRGRRRWLPVILSFALVLVVGGMIASWTWRTPNDSYNSGVADSEALDRPAATAGLRFEPKLSLAPDNIGPEPKNVAAAQDATAVFERPTSPSKRQTSVSGRRPAGRDSEPSNVRTPPAAAEDCTPPYEVDPNGIKSFKPACVLRDNHVP